MSLIRPWKCNIQNRIRESKLAAVQIGGYLCHLGMRSDCAEHLDVKADISSPQPQAAAIFAFAAAVGTSAVGAHGRAMKTENEE